jgi:predicted nucleotidyltransferase
LLERKAAILAIALRHRASHVRVLRRVAWSRGLARGDIDLLFDMASEAGTLGHQALVDELTRLLGVPVGVTVSGTLRPEIESILEAEALPL